jgi:2-octaprenyl-6-methoxyphenol hydroxylase
MTATRYDILIVGGGHAGLLLGTGLARAGARVAVVEPQPRAAILDPPEDGRTLALLAGSVAILERLGALAMVEPLASPIWITRVSDAAGGEMRCDARRELGHPFGLGIENRLLRRALLAAFDQAAGPGALLQGRVSSLRRSGASSMVELESGGAIEASLVVGADGRGSRLRGLAGIGLDHWTYPQSALAFVVQYGAAHGHGVFERLRVAGPIALLPLPGDRSGVTWVDRPARAVELQAAGPAVLADALATETGGSLGTLGVHGPVGLWPLSAQHARRYVAPRLALVGDAAHGSHPIHAQGFNMGVGDVGALVDLVAEALARGQDPGSADLLLRYERLRRPENRRRMLVTDALARLSSSEATPIATMRRLGFDALANVPGLRGLALRHGMQLGPS